MDYASLKEKILGIEIGERQNIYTTGKDVVVFVNKPLKVPKKLKQGEKYDVKKNFQIGLSKGGKKEFLPNHLRILIDLNLKNEENKEKARILFDAIEAIFDGEDPLKFEKQLQALHFDREIETAFTDLCLAQLFMLEQDINYSFGKTQPPRAYLMGYIRMVQLNAKEIDKLLWNSIRSPPPKIYLNPQ